MVPSVMFMFSFEIFCLKGILVAYVLYFETPATLSVKNLVFLAARRYSGLGSEQVVAVPSSNKVGRVSLIVCRIVKTGFII